MAETMVADTEQLHRLIEFASDVTQLADERRDLELHELVSELHADLITTFNTEED